MKVLFAVSNDNITTSVVNKYQQTYKEIITSKNVYYFNAIIKELQNDKTYDAIVIGEDLEPVANNNYEAMDKFLIEKLDRISDEASKPTGENIPIIFICAERRTKSSQLLLRLFSMSIYDALIGNDRSVNRVCALINKPRSKKEAKRYYQIDTDQAEYTTESEELVSEEQIQNILNYYKKIGYNEKKCVEAFDSIAKQYDDTQLRIIVKFLPMSVKAILEINSQRYQQLMSGGTVLSNGKYNKYKPEPAKNQGKLEFLEKDLGKTKLAEPVVIPETMNITSNPVSYNNYNTANNMTQQSMSNQNYKQPNIEQNTNSATGNDSSNVLKNSSDNYTNYNNYMNNNNNLYNNKGYYNLYNQQGVQNNQQQTNQQYNNLNNNNLNNSNLDNNLNNNNPNNNNLNNTQYYNTQYNQQTNTLYNSNPRTYNNQQTSSSEDNQESVNTMANDLENTASNKVDTMANTMSYNSVEQSTTKTNNSALTQSNITVPTTVNENTSMAVTQPMTVEPVKRGRGRPRKTPLVSADSVPKVKRGRGRPRKTPLTSEENINATSEAISAFNDSSSNVLPGFNAIENEDANTSTQMESKVILPGIEEVKTDNENTLPKFEEINTENIVTDLEDVNTENVLPGLGNVNNENILPGLENVNNDVLPGLESVNNEDVLPGLESVNNENILPGIESVNNENNSSEVENALPGVEEINNVEVKTNEDVLPKVNEMNKNTQGTSDNSESENGEDDMNNFNQNPYGKNNNQQNPYGNGMNNQPFYKMNNFNQNPYGGNNPQNPYGNGMNGYNPQNPYGNGINGYNPQNPYGNGMNGYNPQNPYGNGMNGYNPQNPYGNGMNGYNQQNPYDNGMNNNPYNNEQTNNNPYNNDQTNPYSNSQPKTDDVNIFDNQQNTATDLIENIDPTIEEPSGLVVKNGKIALFIGTTKNGTSFIVNNLASILSENGINTAILDLTKNRNAYYMFTDNKSDRMEIASNSLKSLQNGEGKGLEVNKNLTVYTGLPDDNEEIINPNEVIKNVSNKYDVILLDCDFETEQEYYKLANEIYLVQSMDAFTIQPLTKLLSDLKNNNILDESKLRIVINKHVKTTKPDVKMIIGGMSTYNEPSMTLQRDLFNPDNVKSIIISFEEQNYIKYIEDIALCHLSLNGYTETLIQSLDELKNMVYPLIAGNNGGNTPKQYNNIEPKKKRSFFGNKKDDMTFSNDVNNTLNKMRTNY